MDLEAEVAEFHPHVRSLVCEDCFLTLVTLEDYELRIEVSASGYDIISSSVAVTRSGYDDLNQLLTCVSKGYRDSISRSLFAKLERLV
jgi:hypothetical protein